MSDKYVKPIVAILLEIIAYFHAEDYTFGLMLAIVMIVWTASNILFSIEEYLELKVKQIKDKQ